MEKRRKENVKAWGAFDTRLRSVKKVIFQGKFGEKRFDFTIPEKARNFKPADV